MKQQHFTPGSNRQFWLPTNISNMMPFWGNKRSKVQTYPVHNCSSHTNTIFVFFGCIQVAYWITLAKVIDTGQQSAIDTNRGQHTTYIVHVTDQWYSVGQCYFWTLPYSYTSHFELLMQQQTIFMAAYVVKFDTVGVPIHSGTTYLGF